MAGLDGLHGLHGGMPCALRGLVVGQAPPGPPEKLPASYLPLQGQPERRLARLAGLSPSELWSAFDRVDLIGWCPGPKGRKSCHFWSSGYRKHRCDGHRFPMRDARLAAGRLVRFGGLERYSMVVLCGRLVAAAFGLKLQSVPWAEEAAGVRYLVLPHPSGASHFWNDEVSWHRAAGTFRAALRVAQCTAPAESRGLGRYQEPHTPGPPACGAKHARSPVAPCRGVAEDVSSQASSAACRSRTSTSGASGGSSLRGTTLAGSMAGTEPDRGYGSSSVVSMPAVRSRFFARALHAGAGEFAGASGVQFHLLGC